MRKKLLRLLRLVPIALAFAASVASAQTTGTIIGVVTDAATGKPVAGALIVATSPNLQGEQTAVTDAGGNYRLTLLPPGEYKLAVQLEGYKPAERTDITLRVDKTLRANMAVVPEAVQMEEQVVKTGTPPVINIGSAETGSVVSKEFLTSIPVTRDFSGTAVTAPSAQIDMFGIGFGGSGSLENNYILDGMRVNDPGYGNVGSSLLNNFVEEVDVKTGSFMAEYGQTTGGVVNVVTKSGSNEYHGSLWGNISPGALSPSSPAVGNYGEAIAFQATPSKGGYAGDFGFDLGGPIMKDKLWFYAGFAPVLSYAPSTTFIRQRAETSSGSGVALCQLGGVATPCTTPGAAYVMQTIPGTNERFANQVDQYQAMAKLTFLINENNNVALSAYTAPESRKWRNVYNTLPSAGVQSADVSSTDIVARYLGKALDKHLVIEVTGGLHNQRYADTPTTVDGVNQATAPFVNWRDRVRLEGFDPALVGQCAGFTAGGDPLAGTGTTAPGCIVRRFGTGGYNFEQDFRATRWAGRAAVTGLFEAAGSHQLKAGVDVDYGQFRDIRSYSGLAGWNAYPASFDAYLMVRSFGTAASSPGVRSSSGTGPNYYLFWNGDAKSDSLNTGVFVQDSWTILNQLTLNIGLRWDGQSMHNLQADAQKAFYGAFGPVSSLSIQDMWGPRLQAIWDFTGQGKGKISGSWGRFFESIPLDMADRSFGTEIQAQGAWEMSSCTAAAQPGAGFVNGANPLSQCPNAFGLGQGSLGWNGTDYHGTGQPMPTAYLGGTLSPNATTLPANTGLTGVGAPFSQVGGVTPVAPDLKGQYLDMFGGSAEYEILRDMSVGITYEGRRLGRVIEDMSADDGIHYFIANPSASKPWTYAGVVQNPQQALATDPVTGARYTSSFPAPSRAYDGFTVKMTKNFSNNWLAQASYTYSNFRGNYPGLFRYENGQSDPNITSEYDLVSLMSNKQGPLGSDRPNQVKLYGAYHLDVTSRMYAVGGLGFSALQGQPVSVLGAHPLYGLGESFIVPRGMGGRVPWVTNLDLHGELGYTVTAPYAIKFTIDVFNLLNTQEAQYVDQNYTLDAVQPMIGATCGSKNAVSKGDPLAAIQADCPDLKYLRASFAPRLATPNPNWGRPAAGPNILRGFSAPAFQLPIRFRFGLALSF